LYCLASTASVRGWCWHCRWLLCCCVAKWLARILQWQCTHDGREPCRFPSTNALLHRVEHNINNMYMAHHSGGTRRAATSLAQSGANHFCVCMFKHSPPVCFHVVRLQVCERAAADKDASNLACSVNHQTHFCPHASI
jgi:hypothetical protein